MLTARDSVGDRVGGLDAGADDYLVKPFAFEELSARLRALSRRGAAVRRRAQPRLKRGPDRARRGEPRRRSSAGSRVDLSPREFSLLECLLRHAGQTLSRDQLLDQAWPFSVAVTPNAVDAYVHYLRTKLGSASRPAGDRSGRWLSAGPWLNCRRPAESPEDVQARRDDGRLLRSVGWRLVLFSGGTTLLILLVLGLAALSAGRRARSRRPAIVQLDARAATLRQFLDTSDDPGDGAQTGIVFGGGSSGTFAVIVVPPTASRLVDADDVHPGRPAQPGLRRRRPVSGARCARGRPGERPGPDPERDGAKPDRDGRDPGRRGSDPGAARSWT